MDLLSQLLVLATSTQIVVDPAAICSTADCPGSTLNAQGAAMATQGLWVQADILHHILYGPADSTLGGMAQIAYIPILVWVIGCIGGLLGVALGSPPKMYLWFFMGPAIFSFLIGTTEEVKGVRWSIGGIDQNQADVWRLAEPGLVNTNIVRRFISETGINPITASKVPKAAVKVAMPFLYWDSVVSSVVDAFVGWSGVGQPLVMDSSFDSNISNLRMPVGAGAGAVVPISGYLLQSLRWQILDDSLSARLQSVPLRQAANTFMAGECSKTLKTYLSSGKVAGLSGANLKERVKDSNIDDVSLFQNGGTGSAVAASNYPLYENYYAPAIANLSLVTIPTPPDVKQFLLTEGQVGVSGDVKDGSFFQFAPYYRDPDLQRSILDQIDCMSYLRLIVEGFRWQSHLAYWNILRKHTGSGPGFSFDMEDSLPWALFYGWEFRDERPSAGGATPITAETSGRFLEKLTLFSMFRNEFRLMPSLIPTEDKSTISAESDTAAQRAISMMSGKTKYGELYSWVQMIPALQGLLLYFFSILYPFAVIMMLLPGMHKTLFTWMAFWAWIKSWDIGFAFVNGFERSLWSMIGNTEKAIGANSFILETTRWESTPALVSCPSLGAGAAGWVFSNCPNLSVVDGLSVFGTTGAPVGAGALVQSVAGSLAFLDRALLLSNNLNLDYANGQYMFLMAALYLSVPAILGTLILGGKAGMANMASKLIEGAGQDGGSAAKSGAVGMSTTIGQTNKAANDQTKQVAAMRGRGLAGQALAAQNATSAAELRASGLDSENQQLQNERDILNQKPTMINSAGEIAGTKMKMARSVGSGDRAAWAGMGGALSALGTGGLKGIDEGTLVAGGAGTSLKGIAKLGQSGIIPGLDKALGMSGGGGGGVSPADDWHSRAKGEFDQTINGFTGIASASARFDAAQKSAGLDRMQAENRFDQFGARADGSRERGHGDRIGKQAEFEAKQDAWYGQADFAMQMGGWTAAIGMSPGSFAPGAKPFDMMGMAMTGQLEAPGAPGQPAGSQVKDAANFFASGGVFDQQAQSWNGADGRLTKAAQSAAAAYASLPTNMDKAFNQAGSYTANELGFAAPVRDFFSSYEKQGKDANADAAPPTQKSPASPPRGRPVTP